MSETVGMYVQPRIQSSYFPSIPPIAPKTTLSYPRATQDAPYSALVGVVADGRQPDRHPVTSRCRVRRQVGISNRWRLPESLGSDLLGSSQAIKSISMPYNQTLVNIITAESPLMSMNLDVTNAYKFRQTDDRPLHGSAYPRLEARESFAERESFTAQMPPSAPAGVYSVRTITPLKKFIPHNARPVTPKDIFLYHSKRSKSNLGPDTLLNCLGMDWELHRPFLQKSETITNLLEGADEPKPKLYYKSAASETLDNYIKKSNFYSNEYREISNRLSAEEGIADTEEIRKGLDHPSFTSEERVNNVSFIKLEIRDPDITKTAMAIALGNLYHDDLDVDKEQVAGVLAAASVLQFKALIKFCCKMMLHSISYRTVCKYHAVASRHRQEDVVLACERWLELNLIPELSSQIQLRDIPMDLMQKVLKSNRLFVTNEYSVYRTLAYWLFMQLNPHIQLMPTHSSVISNFNSLPKSTCFIERDDGQIYAPLFATVRLHGVTDNNNIQDMQLMNILPQESLISLLTQHYHALQGGGDMSLLKNFNTQAVRQGFVIDDEPMYHSEVMSMHGFHFELKAVGGRDGIYSFYLQRLKPGDPILSFRQCERHTFSMRSDREVRYCITVQYADEQENHIHTTGVCSHKFGLGDKTSKSEKNVHTVASTILGQWSWVLRLAGGEDAVFNLGNLKDCSADIFEEADLCSVFCPLSIIIEADFDTSLTRFLLMDSSF